MPEAVYANFWVVWSIQAARAGESGRGAQETASIAGDTRETSEVLVRMVKDLDGVVRQFRFQ